MSAASLTVAAWLQIYYELKAEREKQGLEKQIALIRVEQLAPFPFDLVCRELRRYPNAEIMWCAVLVQLAPLCLVCSQHAESRAAHRHSTVQRQENIRQRSRWRHAPASPGPGGGRRQESCIAVTFT